MKALTTVKTIRSKSGNLHFKRFAIFESRLFSIYVHRLYRSDDDPHMHNHPWSWCGSLVLSGGYVNARRTEDPARTRLDIVGPLDSFVMRPTDYHKIHTIIDGPVTTLFVAGPRLKSWGYMTEDGHVDHTEYRKKRNES